MAKKHTPYYHKFLALNAKLVERIGFDAAAEFSSTKEEHLATRNAAGLYDVYNQGPLDIKGKDALELVQKLLVNDVGRLKDGRGLYSSMLNEEGGMIDDLTCYRFSEEHFWLVPTPFCADKDVTWIESKAEGMCAHLTNIISGTGYLSVQGPRSRDTLRKLTTADLSTENLPYYSFTSAQVAEVPTVLARTGYSGELGYELYYPAEYAEYVWDTVLDAGKEFGLIPCGLAALRTVRMEKKYLLYGLDMSEKNNPLETGLGWTVKFEKGEFFGREALIKIKGQGVKRKLVGLEMPGMSFLPKAGDSVMVDSKQVGTITSAEYGHYLRKSLALGYLEIDFATDGTSVKIVSGLQSTEAIVKDRPFYDPDSTKLRV